MKKEKDNRKKKLDKSENKKYVKYFFISMVVTLCLSVCLMGAIVVDYNTRWVGFGNDAPIACVTTTPHGEKKLEVNALGMEKSVDITAAYKTVQWTEQTAQQAGELIVAIYDDICKTLSQLFK